MIPLFLDVRNVPLHVMTANTDRALKDVTRISNVSLGKFKSMTPREQKAHCVLLNNFPQISQIRSDPVIRAIAKRATVYRNRIMTYTNPSSSAVSDPASKPETAQNTTKKKSKRATKARPEEKTPKSKRAKHSSAAKSNDDSDIPSDIPSISSIPSDIPSDIQSDILSEQNEQQHEIQFTDRENAQEYCRFSYTYVDGKELKDNDQHRYRGLGNSRYACMTSHCPATREIVQIGTRFKVISTGSHSHSNISQGKRKFIPKSQKGMVDIGSFCLKPAQRYLQNIKVKLTSRQLRNIKYQVGLSQHNNDWDSWIEKHLKSENPETGKILGYHIDDVSRVVVMSSDALLARVPQIVRCAPGYVAIDGKARNLAKPYKLLMMGTQDAAHGFHCICCIDQYPGG